MCNDCEEELFEEYVEDDIEQYKAWRDEDSIVEHE